MEQTSKFKVAVVREEGSNGDREMAAAVRAAGEVLGFSKRRCGTDEVTKVKMFCS